MKKIICFGDSNTYGYIPGGDRFPQTVRWPGILADSLRGSAQIAEEGVCGRTTVFQDPDFAGRCGLSAVQEILQRTPDPDLVILMLGTNDCKTAFGADAAAITAGMERITEEIHALSPATRMLWMAPAPIELGVSKKDPAFTEEAVRISRELTDSYAKCAARLQIPFLALSDLARADAADHEHITEEGHKAVAAAVEPVVRKILQL